MGDQEMQFADPAWQPPLQGSVETNSQQRDPYIPQPMNNDTFGQAQQQDQSYTNTSSYTEGYRAQPGASMHSISGIPLRTRQRRGRSPWLWIVLALIIFSLAGGAFNVNTDKHGHFSMAFPFHSQPFANTQYFSVGVHPTIEITNLTGTITVHAGGSNDKVAIQTDQQGTKLVDTPGANDTHTISVINADPSAEVNLDVTAANGADLVLKTSSGDIDVNGVSGQVNLTSDSGDITLSQDSLAGNSVVNTNSGDITFNGTISPNGSYLFGSQDGSVDVTFPSDASFHGDITTNSGSIDSDFPELNPPSSDVTTVHGDVGSAPQAHVTIKTDSGSINMHSGS